MITQTDIDLIVKTATDWIIVGGGVDNPKAYPYVDGCGGYRDPIKHFDDCLLILNSEWWNQRFKACTWRREGKTDRFFAYETEQTEYASSFGEGSTPMEACLDCILKIVWSKK